MQKPTKELRVKYHTDYADTHAFSSNARLLQSIWRTEKKYAHVKLKCGNFLEEDFARGSGANFLSKKIFEIIKEEVKNKKIEGKVIKEPRIWNNLLSSQPLAFNLFGELSLNLELATVVFQSLYPQRKVKNITTIKFEHSPGRRNPKYTGDGSAFDVFLEYENQALEKCFFGIEVKYAESLNDKPATHKKRYEEISEKAGFFDLTMLQELKEKPIQQIWRDHLLTLSLFITNNDYKRGDFIYLYPEKNAKCAEGIIKYKSTFSNSTETYFEPLTLEKMVSVLKKHSSESWIIDFEDRYLDFFKISKMS